MTEEKKTTEEQLLDKLLSIKHYKEANYPTLIPFFAITATDLFLCLGFILFCVYISVFFIVFVRRADIGIAIFFIGLIITILFFILSKYMYSIERKIRGTPPTSNIILKYFFYLISPNVKRCL